MRIWFVYCFLKPHSSMTFKEENDLTGKNGSCLMRAEEPALLLSISWSLLKLLTFLLFCCENSIEKVGGTAHVFSWHTLKGMADAVSKYRKAEEGPGSCEMERRSQIPFIINMRYLKIVTFIGSKRRGGCRDLAWLVGGELLRVEFLDFQWSQKSELLNASVQQCGS